MRRKRKRAASRMPKGRDRTAMEMVFSPGN
jgi:hypothetical protein